MKKLFIKMFPILGEPVPVEWMEETHQVYRLCMCTMYMGSIVTMIVTGVVLFVLRILCQ